MARFESLLAVAIGGIAGSLIRWGLLVASPDDRGRWVIFGANLSAAALLGAVIGLRSVLSERVFYLTGTGFAGGLSTFSTFAVTVAQDLDQGALLAATGNTVGTMALAVVAAGIGYRLCLGVQIRLGVRRRRRALAPSAVSTTRRR